MYIYALISTFNECFVYVNENLRLQFTQLLVNVTLSSRALVME